MTTHTPAPWKAVLMSSAWEILASNGESIALNSSAYQDFGVPSEHEANARLIAAAPELLRACRELVRSIEAGEAEGDSFTMAELAIAKAEGP